MCGIIGAFNTQTPKERKNKAPVPNVNDFVIDTYEDQHTRGKEGFGLITIDIKKDVTVHRATEPVKFLLDLKMNPSPMIIAHHRMPTSTDNKLSQTHPIFVSNESLAHDYFVIHNGIISNAEELKDKHDKLGFVYTTKTQDAKKFGYQYYRSVEFNDSESLAIELALLIEGRSVHLGHQGSAAFIVLQTDKKTGKALRVFFGRDSSPIQMHKQEGQLCLSSEGIGESVPRDLLHSFLMSDPAFNLTTVPFKIVPYGLPKPTVVSPLVSRYSRHDDEWRHWKNLGDDSDRTEIKTKEVGQKISANEEKLSDMKTYLDSTVEAFKDDIRNQDIEYIGNTLEEETEGQSSIIKDELETFFSYLQDPYTYKECNVNETLDVIKSALILCKRFSVAAHAESAIAETSAAQALEEKEVSTGKTPITNVAEPSGQINDSTGAIELPHEHNITKHLLG